MKYNYKELTGKYKNCGGFMRLESLYFSGTNKCKYEEEPIQKIKQILGIMERIKI